MTDEDIDAILEMPEEKRKKVWSKLTGRERGIIKTLLQAKSKNELKTKYSKYAEYVHHGLWKPARHLLYICKRLEDVEAGSLKRVMIFLPPRHGKSMTVTETFPSFFICKNPERRVIEVSYGDDLAQRFGKLNRQKITEFGKDLFDVEISKEKSSMTDWDISGHRGGMISVGIGGGITGLGADLLIVDDPIKNKEQAESEVIRDKIWAEWQTTLLTRLHPNAAIVIILTRWHEDDLAGRLLNPEYGKIDNWEIINLPAEAEENDLLGRKPGELLWPDHGYDKEWAESNKIAVGSATWAALYQQRPTAQEGAMIKRHWWKYYDKLPDKFDYILQSWDMSFKDSDGTDYVSGQVWGIINNTNIYLIDRIKERMDFPHTCKAVESMTEKHPKALTKLIEDKANGPAVISMLKYKIAGLIAVEPKGSKEARVSAVSPLIEAGNVYLPNASIAPWVLDFVEECTSFPNGAHDDDVDAMSQALNRFMYAGAKPDDKKDKANQEFYFRGQKFVITPEDEEDDERDSKGYYD